MELLDLPDECILQALAFLPIASVLGCTQAGKRLRSLVHSDLLWLSRLQSDYGLTLKVSPSHHCLIVAVEPVTASPDGFVGRADVALVCTNKVLLHSVLYLSGTRRALCPAA